MRCYTHFEWLIVLEKMYLLTQKILILKLLLARLESAYSLIWGAREIWGKSGGETLALL